MIPNRSESSRRSTASRRALAIFVLSAVVSSSVLAAPTIHPQTISLSLSESDPTSTQTSSGPGSLSGGGHLATTLQGPEGVDHSNVVVRQDGPDGLQAFKDSDLVQDSPGSNPDDLLVTVNLEQRGSKFDRIFSGQQSTSGASDLVVVPMNEEEKTKFKASVLDQNEKTYKEDKKLVDGAQNLKGSALLSACTEIEERLEDLNRMSKDAQKASLNGITDFEAKKYHDLFLKAKGLVYTTRRS
ncbi:hypothetical protein C8R42DRAFT_724356 [Lentinula raphanica]|nr:hypothetical protein C8R42DRAFT_724356 [Lentinula raphanica]